MADRDEVDSRDPDGWSRLDHAAAHGGVAQVSQLLAAGADPLATGPDGRRPYDIALAAGRLDAAAALRVAEDGRAAPVDRSWRPFCKAYRVEDVRGFAGWPVSTTDGDGSSDPDGAIVYVHDDLSVTRSAWHGAQVVFEDVSPEWTAYCRDVLRFAVPDDFDLAVPAGDEPG